MTLFILRRIGLGLVILLIVALLLFGMMHMIPGDPTVVALGPRSTPEMREAFRQLMGLDRSVFEQLGLFLRRLSEGNLGEDVWSRRPVLTMILEVMPYTVTLAVASFIWAVALGIALGCAAVVHHGRWPDWLIGILSVGLVAVPSFVVSLYSLLIFAVTLNWLPAIGAGEPGDIMSQARALILPSFAIGLGWVGYVSRIVRAAMIEAMGEAYVRTLRSFGVPERKIIYRYALKQAFLAVLSVIAIGFGGLLTGSVFAEIVFSRPGLGKMTYDAVISRNYPVVMGTVLMTSGLYVTCMIIADVVTAFLDPRVRALYRMALAAPDMTTRAATSEPGRLSRMAGVMRQIIATPLGAIGCALVMLIVLTALFAPWIAPYSPTAINVKERLADPSWSHLLGTDQLGRDLFSRVILGTRTAMTVALVSLAVALAAALPLGLIAGYGPRWLDACLILVFDSLSSLPMIMFGLAMVVLLGAGISTVILVIVIYSVPSYARLIRTQTLSIKARDFIKAEQAMNAGLGRILFVHLLPNVIGPLLILACLDLSTIITLEAGLSFLGLGVKPQIPSWGNILSDGFAVIRTTPLPVIAGGLPLILATIGFTFFGEALRDALDPKLARESRP